MIKFLKTFMLLFSFMGASLFFLDQYEVFHCRNSYSKEEIDKLKSDLELLIMESENRNAARFQMIYENIKGFSNDYSTDK